MTNLHSTETNQSLSTVGQSVADAHVKSLLDSGITEQEIMKALGYEFEGKRSEPKEAVKKPSFAKRIAQFKGAWSVMLVLFKGGFTGKFEQTFGNLTAKSNYTINQNGIAFDSLITTPSAKSHLNVNGVIAKEDVDMLLEHLNLVADKFNEIDEQLAKMK